MKKCHHCGHRSVTEHRNRCMWCYRQHEAFTTVQLFLCVTGFCLLAFLVWLINLGYGG